MQPHLPAFCSKQRVLLLLVFPDMHCVEVGLLWQVSLLRAYVLVWQVCMLVLKLFEQFCQSLVAGGCDVCSTACSAFTGI